MQVNCLQTSFSFKIESSFWHNIGSANQIEWKGKCFRGIFQRSCYPQFKILKRIQVSAFRFISTACSVLFCAVVSLFYCHCTLSAIIFAHNNVTFWVRGRLIWRSSITTLIQPQLTVDMHFSGLFHCPSANQESGLYTPWTLQILQRSLQKKSRVYKL